MTGRPIANKLRRGDVIAWCQMHDYTRIDGSVTAPVAVYYIGIVTSVTRDGIARMADTGFGRTPVYLDIDSAGVRGEQIDLDKARAWLASAANYPSRGSTPLRSMDDVRAVVRQWLRDS
jgi:hypothetical protein